MPPCQRVTCLLLISCSAQGPPLREESKAASWCKDDDGDSDCDKHTTSRNRGYLCNYTHVISMWLHTRAHSHCCRSHSSPLHPFYRRWTQQLQTVRTWWLSAWPMTVFDVSKFLPLKMRPLLGTHLLCLVFYIRLCFYHYKIKPKESHCSYRCN